MKQRTFWIHAAESSKPILHGTKITVRGKSHDEIERKLEELDAMAGMFGASVLHWEPSDMGPTPKKITIA